MIFASLPCPCALAGAANRFGFAKTTRGSVRNTLCDGLSSPRPDQAARSGPVVYPTLEPYRAGLIWRYKARMQRARANAFPAPAPWRDG